MASIVFKLAIILGSFVLSSVGFSFTNKFNKIRRIIHIDRFESNDMWDHGEVVWDIPEEAYSQADKDEDVIIIYKNNTKIGNDTNFELSDENTIYQKYFKNRFYFRVNKGYVREIYGALINSTYNDVVKLENFIIDMQDLAIYNMKGQNMEFDLALLLIASGLSLLYNKNKIENIEYISQQSRIKRIKQEKSKMIKRVINLLFIIFITVFWRNIKNAE
jgi:hypothetical protein